MIGTSRRMKLESREQHFLSPDFLTASPGPGGWELVYFAHPVCSGTCAHCWSANHYLGRSMPLEWHRRFWRLVAPDRIREVRLTGGEPLENRDLAQIVDLVSGSMRPETPIRIFTSGRPVVSRNAGDRGVAETAASLHRAGLVKPGVEIDMSADEHHAGAVYRQLVGIRHPPATHGEALHHNELGMPVLLTMVANFLGACRRLVKQTDGAFRGGRLEVHVAEGRFDFHRNHMYGSFADDWWNENVDFSEGLLRAGRACEWSNTLTVKPRTIPSMFVVPGAEFRRTPQSRSAQEYRDVTGTRSLFLDKGRQDGDGACILGFWNLVTRTFCGGSAVDALQLVGQLDSVSKWTRPR